MNDNVKGCKYHLKNLIIIQSTGKMCIINLDSRKILKECLIANSFQIRALIKVKYEKEEELVTIRTQNIRMVTVQDKFYIVLTYNSICLMSICFDNGVPYIDIITIHTQ